MLTDEQVIKVFRKKNPNLWAALVLCGAALMLIIVIIIEANTRHDKEEEKYDWIVVGGGPAGCLIADRLSASGRDTVLYLDPGVDVDDEPIISEITRNGTLFIEDLFYGRWFWQITQSTSNERYTDGKVLGGSSSVDDLKYVRGTHYLFNQIELLTGDPIWNSENVMQAYREIETYHGMGYSPDRHGAVGEMDITEGFTIIPQTTPTTLANKFVTAVERMSGITRLTDYNDMLDSSELGPFVSWQYHAKPNGVRESSSTAHLTDPVKSRRNLHIRLGAEVNKIIFDTRNRARSVRYSYRGNDKTAAARTRIILAADKQTPILLQLSGVGDADVLHRAGIRLVYNSSEVGKNVNTHQAIPVVYSRNAADFPSNNHADLYDGGAWLGNPTPIDPNTGTEVSPRRIQVVAFNGESIDGDPLLNVTLVDLSPHTKGYILPYDDNNRRIFNISEGPLDDLDVLTLRNAIKYYACGIHKEFQGLNILPAIDSTYQLITPSPSICNNNNTLDAYVRDHIRVYQNHWTGSCKLGSVVDSKGSVLGLRGLTIADTNILPYNFDGDLVAPSLAIAHIISRELLLGNVVDN